MKTDEQDIKSSELMPSSPARGLISFDEFDSFLMIFSRAGDPAQAWSIAEILCTRTQTAEGNERS